MGTYTTNKNLFMPTVGETGWGTLVNNNFSTIDTFLKPITVSGSTYTFTGNHVGNQSGGSISATSITNSGTLTNTGKITANGGIGTTSLTTSSTITSTGKVTANGGIGTTTLTTSSTITSTGKVTVNNVLQCQKIYVNGRILTTKMSNYSPVYAATETQSVSISATPNQTLTSSTITVSGAKIKSLTYPVRVGCATYIPAAANITSGSVGSVSRTVTLKAVGGGSGSMDELEGDLYVNGSKVLSILTRGSSTQSNTHTVKNGDTIYVVARTDSSGRGTVSATVSAVNTHYLDGI